MKLFDLDRWGEIWETIKRNKKRSIMTAFGVFWGIFMLVFLMGIGMGLSNLVNIIIGEMSFNTAFTIPQQTSVPYKGMESGRYWELHENDVSRIRQEVKGIKYIEGILNRVSYAKHNQYKGQYSLLGENPNFIHIQPYTITRGRFLNQIDIDERRKVCVIGTQIQKDLFPNNEDPIGQIIEIENSNFTIVGIITKQSEVTIFSNPEFTIILPLPILQQMRGGGHNIDAIIANGYDDVDLNEVIDKAKHIIFNNHTIAPNDDKAILTINLGDEFKLFGRLFGGVTILTWIVGLGTLLAGIVGVSNIMLVVVKERTQEIGIRRAIGAPPRVIISQILSESFVLTFLAGIFGLAAAVGGLSIVENILAHSSIDEETLSMQCQITFWLGITAAGIIVISGVLAGILPAHRAIKIKAVDALRDE